MTKRMHPIQNLISGIGHIATAVRASSEYQRLNRLPANSAARSSRLRDFFTN